MAANKLRAVSPGEAPQARKKLTVAEAAATGDELATQVSIRDRLAVTITDPDCSPRDLAALTKRLGDTMEQIKTLTIRAADASEESADVDDSFDASAI